jgi:hypothetical protein
MEAKVNTVEAQKGDKGDQGAAGKAGKDGKDGRDGSTGLTGSAGKDGVDGVDGVSIVDAIVDIDGHLVLTLSNGNEIDAGDLTEAWKESDKVIQILRGGGPNTQQIKEDIKNLQDRADANDTKNNEQDSRLTTNESDIDTLESRADANDTKNNEQDSRLTTNESDIDNLESRADANDVTNTQQNTRLTTLEARDEVFVFTTTQTITAFVPLIVNHNLSLVNRDAFIIRVADNTGEEINVENTSINNNSIRLDSFVTLPNAVITIIGF